MLHREIINKMDADELRNYLYHLQSYTKVVREINSVRKASEDSLICLLHHREDLSVLTIKAKNQIDRLERLTEEMEHKYSTSCPSCFCEDNTFKSESEVRDETHC